MARRAAGLRPGRHGLRRSAPAPAASTAIKNLREHGFGVDCYERETGVGGAWNWRHDRSPVYASTHLISSQAVHPVPRLPDAGRLAGLPAPQPGAGLPRALRRPLRPARSTSGSAPRWSGSSRPTGRRWDVTTRSTGGDGAERTQRYAAVVVANGHNWSPKLPAYEGLDDFRGEVIHASAYKDAGPAARPAGARGRRRQHRLRHRGRGGPAGGRGAGTRPGAATGTRRSTSSAAPPTRSTTWCSRCGCRCGCASGCSTARCG